MCEVTRVIGKDASLMVRRVMMSKSQVGGFSKEEQQLVLSDRSHFSGDGDAGEKWREVAG